MWKRKYEKNINKSFAETDLVSKQEKTEYGTLHMQTVWDGLERIKMKTNMNKEMAPWT